VNCCRSHDSRPNQTKWERVCRHLVSSYLSRCSYALRQASIRRPGIIPSASSIQVTDKVDMGARQERPQVCRIFPQQTKTPPGTPAVRRATTYMYDIPGNQAYFVDIQSRECQDPAIIAHHALLGLPVSAFPVCHESFSSEALPLWRPAPWPWQEWSSSQFRAWLCRLIEPPPPRWQWCFVRQEFRV
jgi:hypothetical protein